MEHVWTSQDGVRWRNTPERVFCYAKFDGREVEIDMGLPDKRDAEILRLAEKLQALEIVAGEAEAALLMQRCGCSETFICSRCKALKALRPDFVPPWVVIVDRIVSEGE